MYTGILLRRGCTNTAKAIHTRNQIQIQSRALALSAQLQKRVDTVSVRHANIYEQLLTEKEPAKLEAHGKELSQLNKLAELAKEQLSVREELETIEMLAEDESNDGDTVQFLMDEKEEMMAKLSQIEDQLTNEMLRTSDKDNQSDAILEIRAGTGGDEASLFASELLAAYEKYAKAQGWKWEVLTMTKTELGGLRESSVSISSNSYSESSGSDNGVFGQLQYESGVHRVQRVPINDVRIHTSAVSVAILPAVDENSHDSEGIISTSDLKIETMRASGAGGQHVNTTESAIRITHLPTGITASIQDERSQHKNKAKALKLIAARVSAKLRAEEIEKRGAMRSEAMGGGSRSERIRTYNFPQDRCTDHRCKVSEYGLNNLMSMGSGGAESSLVEMFLPHMQEMRRDEMLKELEEEELKFDGTRQN